MQKGQPEQPSLVESVRVRGRCKWAVSAGSSAAYLHGDVPRALGNGPGAQWDSWSPPEWYDEFDFSAAAESFSNPDWLAITLHGYRHRWQSEVLDTRYEVQRARIAATECLDVPTLMIQGGDDRCDPPFESEGQDRWFTSGYERSVIDQVGHFPARESPAEVARAVIGHFDGYAWR